jgi:hypothetical protein
MPDAQARQMWMQDLKSLNFEPLRAVAAELANMGGYAEHYAHTDPEGAVEWCPARPVRGLANRTQVSRQCPGRQVARLISQSIRRKGPFPLDILISRHPAVQQKSFAFPNISLDQKHTR